MKRIIQHFLPGGVMIKGYMIAGTRCAVFNAWKPIPGPMETAGASTITSEAGRWFGRIGTDPDRALYDDLPIGSDARCQAVADAYAKRFDAAYRLIKHAFPELADPSVRATLNAEDDHGEICIEIEDLDRL